MKSSNIIEVNGRQYDAISGQLLSAATPVMAEVAPAELAVAAAPSVSAPAKKQSVHHQAPHAARSQETSKTLMRHSVHKPSGSLKRHTKAHSSTDHVMKQPAHSVAPKHSVRRIDGRRVERAKKVGKSQTISHFTGFTGSNFEPVLPVDTTRVVESLPAHPTTALLEHALQRATSHRQPAHRLKSKKRLTKAAHKIGALSAGITLLIAFIAYQNLTNVKLDIASSHAGFTASLPAQRPAGFSFGGVSYSVGSVSMHFKSNSDQRSFAIIEKPTSWDDQALVNNFVASSDPQYRTVQGDHTVIYLYGQANATWLSDGIWYQVQSNNALSDQQLEALANS